VGDPENETKITAGLINVFNYINFYGAQTSFGAGDCGRVTCAGNPRIAEFALHYQF
jgi:hypothetical protein